MHAVVSWRPLGERGAMSDSLAQTTGQLELPFSMPKPPCQKRTQVWHAPRYSVRQSDEIEGFWVVYDTKREKNASASFFNGAAASFMCDKLNEAERERLAKRKRRAS